MTVSFDVTDKITAKTPSGVWYEVRLTPSALITRWNWMRRPAGKLETLGALLGLVGLRVWRWVRRRSGWSVLVCRAVEFPTEVPVSERGAILARADFATKADAARDAESVRQSIVAGDFRPK